MMIRMAFVIAGLALLGSPARGGDDPRVDPKTGAELAHYPPARPFDHLHMRLEIDIPDMEKAYLTAKETLTVTPIGQERDQLVLDAFGMDVSAVRVNGAAAKFEMGKGHLTINFPSALKLGQKGEIEIDYALDYSKGRREEGLTWLAANEESKSPTNASPLVYSQGETDFNHHWFPCHDFPNERLTTELIVTVEDPYTVVSNGHLVETTLGAPVEGRARTTWHWLQDKPHANYLVTLVVAKYSIVGLPPADEATTPRGTDGKEIPCYLYAPIGAEAAAAKAFAKTPAILAFYSERFGRPYPWDKYAQVLVRGFNGGMENTSATTMTAGLANLPGRGMGESIIAHEAGHQWFGDLMTCKSWEHAWLNEGWASFCEALWAEHAAAEGASHRAYQRTMSGFMGRQRSSNNTHAPDFAPMVSNMYSFSMQNFMKANDIYSKGALLLHVLRTRLGDDVFFAGVKLYVQRNQFKEVETDDFRHALEEVSGLDLERLFTQWCSRVGIPRLAADLEWKGEESGNGGTLELSLEETQHIDADNPAYMLDVPVVVHYEGDATERFVIHIDGRSTEQSFKLRAKPEDVVLDPELTCGAATKVRKPLGMWLQQIQSDSVFAQIQAAEHLAMLDDPAAALALVRVALAPDSDQDVRRLAGAALMYRAQSVASAFLESPRAIAQGATSPRN
jgi:aminopeptidase N